MLPRRFCLVHESTWHNEPQFAHVPNDQGRELSTSMEQYGVSQQVFWLQNIYIKATRKKETNWRKLGGAGRGESVP